MRKAGPVAIVAVMAVVLNAVPASPRISVPVLDRLVPSVSAASGGPVILDGTDPGDHGSWNGSAVTGQWLYVKKVYENLNNAVSSQYKTASNKKIAVIGAADSTAPNAGDPGSAAHYAAQTMSPSLSVDYYNGASAISSFLASVEQGTAKPALIHIVDAGSVRNALDLSEQTAVNAAANAIATHVNRGGALFANTGNYGWLTTLFPSLAITSDRGSALELTASGQSAFPGLTNADMRAQWHNGFSNTAVEWPLAVLAREGNANGVLGGASVTLPSSVTVTATPSSARTGSSVCLTVNVKRGNPLANVSGATVTFSISAPNSTASLASAVTDANGNTPSRCYSGTLPGTDTITATAVNTSDGASLGEGVIGVTWSLPPSEVTITPTTTSATLGSSVCFVVKVRRGEPLAAFAGASVTFSVSGAGAGTTMATATTNTAGESSSRCLKSTAAGTSTITATAVKTSPLPAVTLGSATATVLWAAAPTTTTVPRTTTTSSTTTTVPRTTTTTAPSLLPLAPSSVKGTASPTQVDLTWAAPYPAPASPVTDYVVQYSSDFGKTWTTFSHSASATAAITVTGLVNGTQYKFRVAAVNAYGTSAYSASSTGVWVLAPVTTTIPVTTTTTIAPAKPAAPLLHKVTAGPSQATVFWYAPTPAPASPVTDYVVQYSSDFGKTWTTFQDGTSTALSTTVTGLTTASQYKFRVAAVNAVGTSAYSNLSVGVWVL